MNINLTYKEVYDRKCKALKEALDNLYNIAIDFSVENTYDPLTQDALRVAHKAIDNLYTFKYSYNKDSGL